MKIKTSELQGAALDWAVSVALYGFAHGGASYSSNWAQGGPIIEREGIQLRSIRKEGHSLDGHWLSKKADNNTGTMVQWVKRLDWHDHYFQGPTPLIAAMRCYVTSKLGDEVDMPEELL